MANKTVMDMLSAVLDGDSQKLEQLIVKNPNHVNYPVGLPFEAHSGRFFNHPAMQQCVILQHPDQKLLDIACALPSGPVVWVLAAHGANGSRHPLGTDLAFHNAIKNGRTYTVQSLLHSGKSSIHGFPGTTWKPLLQAVYGNIPDVVRLLLDRGANVNDMSPWVDSVLKSPLQFCLEGRANRYMNPVQRDRFEKVLKMLLDAGANIHIRPADDQALTSFESFIKPWQGDPLWVAKLSPTEIECLEAFVEKGADLQVPFNGFPCGALSRDTFEHQVLWHSAPAAARLLIDHATPTVGGNGANLLHEILGSCPDAKRHPAETLRDVEVLLKRGADPNREDSQTFTPLRRCIEKCPAVDIVPRLRLLLDAGADPELKHGNRLAPYVLAARNFDEPLRSQVMDFLVAKIKGRQPRVVYDETFKWSEGYFPIPDEPNFAQVQRYNGQNGDFNANLQRMVPEDVQAAFQRAAFSVASMNFLNAATERAKMTAPLQLTVSEKDEIYQIVAQRQSAGFPEYRFDQEFVMGLLKPQMAPVRAQLGSALDVSPLSDPMLPHQTPISSTAPTVPDILATSSSLATTTSSRRSSTSSNDSAGSFFIPSTTQIRWPALGRETRPADIKKAKSAVLKHKCADCGDGNLLTQAELEKHAVEHEHSMGCMDEACKRRFCAAKG